MKREITVIGRGLIGRALPNGESARKRSDGLPWNDRSELSRRFRRIIGELDERRLPQAIVWTAGRSVIASPEADCRQETDAFRLFLDTLSTSSDPRRYFVVLASSIGGLYAGSPTGTFIDEGTVPRPTSAYGREKLHQEDMLRELCVRTGARSVLARIATAYGPDQDPTKAQGIISGLIAALRSGRPLRIFVPLDTSRSYLWVDDIGRTLELIATEGDIEAGETHTRLLAGDRMVSIIELLEIFRRVIGRRPPVLISRGPARALHATHLSVRPRAMPPIRLTPLEVGLARCWRAAVSRSAS